MTDRTIHGDARNLDFSRFRKYQTIIADPPWWYADQRKVRKDGKTPTRGIGACHHYTQLKTDEICNVPVQKLADERCHLYLWATCPLLPDAMRVMERWGFKYITVFQVWIKLNKARALKHRDDIPHFSSIAIMDWFTSFGPGYYTGSNIELVLLGRRGKPFRHAKGCKSPQVVYDIRRGHSEKPEHIQDCIERMYPDATPRLELFATRRRPLWDVFGNQIAT